MRCRACNNILRLKINPKTGKLEDLCDGCISAAYNPDAVTSDEEEDAAKVVEYLDDNREVW
jgi:hypothetical protein